MSSRSSIRAARLAAHLEDEVTPSERAAIEAELRESASARRTLEQLRNLKELLAAPAPNLENMDLAARVRVAVRKEQKAPPPPPRARRLAAFLLGGLAACIGCALFFSHRQPEFSEFRAKGDDSPLLEGRRWAGIQVHRLGERDNVEPLGATLSRNDGLLFSYTNLGQKPFDYLMIFGADAAGEVHWFYPAYESTAQNPVSIAIAHGRANAPLGELVQQDLAEGPLVLYALFTKQPLSVLEVEAWLKKDGQHTDHAPVAGAVLQRIDTRVVQ
ncbi:MAG TPA: hypothetical protein VFK05_22330 [Polyangiaceae bacterium]|nr:hypothetical protein [Polyangiaceae bacterium]